MLRRSRVFWNLLLACGVMGTALASCTMLVDFEPDRRPCAPDADDDGQGECIDGYTCMYDRCVADGSVPLGSTCTVDAHCESRAICTDFVCARSCNRPFWPDECTEERICVVGSRQDNDSAAACLPSDISCQSEAETCVAIDGESCRCMIPCTINCEPRCDGGQSCEFGCQDDCPLGPLGQRLKCQPVGPQRTLVCLDPGPGYHGQPCDLEAVDGRCADGFVCATHENPEADLCLALCDPSGATSSPCAELADPYSGESLATCVALPEGYGVCGSWDTGSSDP